MTPWTDLLDQTNGTLHATLIDPATTGASDAAKLAEALDRAGTDLYLIGGSTDVTNRSTQGTVDAIKEVSQAPVVLFPSSHTQMVEGLDGLLFTITFNATLQPVIIEEPSRGAEAVLGSDLEAITTAYVIVEPGMTVGEVTRAALVARDEEGAHRARRYAHLAKVLGMDAIYLEAGSGASQPVPGGMIEEAATAGVPLIVGGGIRTPEQARTVAQAGADMVVTGTVAEEGDLESVEAIIDALAG